MTRPATIWMISTMADFAQYSIDRLQCEADAIDVALRVMRPTSLRTIPGPERLAMLVDGVQCEPPDILFVKTGASTVTPETLRSMQMLERWPGVKTTVINPPPPPPPAPPRLL